MKQDILESVRIVELQKDGHSLPDLFYHYLTAGYYEVSVVRESEAWKVELALRSFDKPVEKSYKGKFFEPHVQEPRAFAAVLNGVQVGWIELGYEKWNNRMRVWEFLVKEENRKTGIGSLLIDFAVKLSKEKGARMLVLETQSCNVPAITFYLRQGFSLVGFDSTAYSNEDIEKKEVRLELGLAL